MGNLFSTPISYLTFFSISALSGIFLFKKRSNPIFEEALKLKKEKKYSESQKKLEELIQEQKKSEYLIELAIIYLLNNKDELFLKIKEEIELKKYPIIMKQTQDDSNFKGLEYLAKGNNNFEKGKYQLALDNYELSLFLYGIEEEMIHNIIYSCLKLKLNDKALFYSSIEYSNNHFNIKDAHQYLQSCLSNQKNYDGIYSFSYSDSKLLKK